MSCVWIDFMHLCMMWGLRNRSNAMKGYLHLNFKTFLGLSKRPSASEASSIIPKKAKANETGSENESPLLSSVKPPDDLVHEKGKNVLDVLFGRNFI